MFLTAVEKLLLPPGRPTQPNVQDLCSVWGGPLRVSGAKTYTVGIRAGKTFMCRGEAVPGPCWAQLCERVVLGYK